MSFFLERCQLWEILQTPAISGSKLTRVSDKADLTTDAYNVGYKGYKFRIDLPKDSDYTTPSESMNLFAKRVVSAAYKGLPAPLFKDFMAKVIESPALIERDFKAALEEAVRLIEESRAIYIKEVAP